MKSKRTHSNDQVAAGRTVFLAALRQALSTYGVHLLAVVASLGIISAIKWLVLNMSDFFKFEGAVARLFDTLGSGTLFFAFAVMAALIVAETAALVLLVLRHYRNDDHAE